MASLTTTTLTLPPDVHDRILLELQTQFRQLFPHVPLITKEPEEPDVQEEVLDEGVVMDGSESLGEHRSGGGGQGGEHDVCADVKDGDKKGGVVAVNMSGGAGGDASVCGGAGGAPHVFIEIDVNMAKSVSDGAKASIDATPADNQTLSGGSTTTEPEPFGGRREDDMYMTCIQNHHEQTHIFEKHGDVDEKAEQSGLQVAKEDEKEQECAISGSGDVHMSGSMLQDDMYMKRVCHFAPTGSPPPDVIDDDTTRDENQNQPSLARRCLKIDAPEESSVNHEDDLCTTPPPTHPGIGHERAAKHGNDSSSSENEDESESSGDLSAFGSSSTLSQGECSDVRHMSGGCQVLCHGKQVRFICASFPVWRNSLVTSPLSMTKKKLRTGGWSLRTSVKVVCGITGAPLPKHVVIRGPVYRVHDSVDVEHAKQTVHDHTVAILYRTYVRCVASVRTFAASKSLLPVDYAELQFDKTAPQHRVVVPSIPLLPANLRVQLAGNYKMKVHASKAELELMPAVKVVSALKKAAVESRCFPASVKGCSVCSFASTPYQFGCRLHDACGSCTGVWAHIMQTCQHTHQRRPCPCCVEVGAPSPTKRQRVFEPSSSDDGVEFSANSEQSLDES